MFVSFSEIKYQLHLCLVKLRDYKQALNVLQSIPSKQRKIKINMALAKLNHQMGNIVPAATAYNKVLKVSIWSIVLFLEFFFF